VTGYFDSTDARIAGIGTQVGTAWYHDAFVIALNASNGTPKASWGISGSGIQKFGGTGSDVGYGITTNGTSVYVTGTFDSNSVNIGLSGTSIARSGFQDAFVIALNAVDGTAQGWGQSFSGIQTFGG